MRVGDWCFAVGNPFLLATDFTPSVSYGIVSGVHRYQYPSGTLLEYADCIQTDAAINPGNSGGPLFNARGEVIGINGRGSFEKRGRVNVGVGYAISINQIKNFLGYLKSGRIVDHATLGAVVTHDDEGRVLVNDILETSDAYRRGLRYDDEIVRFGGRDIHTVNAFKNVLGIFPRDWRVPLTYQRDGKRHDIAGPPAGRASQRRIAGEDAGPPAAAARDRGPSRTKSPRTSPTSSRIDRSLSGRRRPRRRAAATPMPEHVKAALRGPAGLRELLLQPPGAGADLEGAGRPAAISPRLEGAWTFEGTLEGLGERPLRAGRRQGHA